MKRKARWLWAAAPLVILVAWGLFSRNAGRHANAGIALSFDDRASIESWGQAREFLKQHGLRATFFVDRFNTLTEEQLRVLRELAADGHEIGCHGFRHHNAQQLMQRGMFVEEYLQTDVFPALGEMDRLGFPCRSFAYPHGAGTAEIDRALTNHFAMVRSVDSISPYFDGAGGPYVGAIYVDRESFPRRKLAEILRKARSSGAVASLSAHKIGPQGGDYWCSFETLESIAHLAKRLGLPFYTMTELAGRVRP